MTEHPAPPWRTRARSRTARQPLSQEAVVDAALAVIKQEGLGGLSMRRVAQELGTGPASLYAHVSAKEELLELLVDRVSAEITVPEPDPQRWAEQIRDVARQAYRIYASHSDLALASLARIPTGPNALRVTEAMLAILLAGGVPPQAATWFLDRLFLYIAGDAYEGALYAEKVRASGQDMRTYWDRLLGQLRTYILSLPERSYPSIRAHVDEMLTGDGDERFEFGLDLMIRGVADHIPPR
ncbi:TetR family transcriptional regulator [Micromonospora globispora]|uniref:TetR family transcriptional regulator n=1 Tax=Micromonospora globispora TaxID=1450148 RepID=A0A317JYM7_9ACTN|nr:TetR/AcrR family transcriptional regulator [Micromonospora globispora]PWU45124.1 TetR family transcriptional regulator [Micromonospora globispora]PWU58706.1 TetR family transcriptional regulator [Micromonospora globispora]RQW88919.1 TetR family transcriptional regulator [Micromonospora globispora]